MEYVYSIPFNIVKVNTEWHKRIRNNESDSNREIRKRTGMMPKSTLVKIRTKQQQQLNHELRFRQVHLDFHTPEQVAGVGERFDPEKFVWTLKKAHVNSITCFARGHHGWMYFDTQKFPEKRHPNLTCNLLKEQIDICHKHDIRVPVYTSVEIDYQVYKEHPEWMVVDENGKIDGQPVQEPGLWQFICLNTPYVDFLKAHIIEILETFDVDGLFFDIVKPKACCCSYCREGMEKAGLNPLNPDDRVAYGLQVVNKFKLDIAQLVRSYNKNGSLFFNAGFIGPRHKKVIDAYTHFEIESLPSAWGYEHFPLTARYCRTTGLDYLGMTGKFHTAWGDFNSMRNKEMLDYECYRSLALGAKCMIGDHAHPSMKLDKETYDFIGSVYENVAQKEPWCTNTKAVTDVGVLTAEEFKFSDHGSVPASILGASSMLTQLFCQFDVLDSECDFKKYSVIILPDEIPVNQDLADKLKTYIQEGGSVLATYKSGLNEQETEFALEELGVSFKQEAPYNPDFIRVYEPLKTGLPNMDLVMYERGLEVNAVRGTEILADVLRPMFNRTHEHFYGHRHAPASSEVVYPGIVRKGNCIYCAHPVFSTWHKHAPRWCKQIARNALNMLLPKPLIKTSAPSTALVTINEQEAENRWVVHILHYIPIRRTKQYDVIEDMIPLNNVKVSVKVPKRVAQVQSVPNKKSIPFHRNGQYLEFTVPEVLGHHIISIQF
jgi:Hypothetical glycosyl hydrolase 6/Beta-galactosidase trimerisation domain